jgi:hypothetical protein
LRNFIETLGRLGGRAVWALLLLLTASAPVSLSAQSTLEQFSYDSLRLSGIQFDLGALGSTRLRGAVTGGLRVDYGYIAPNVRVLFGLSYFKANFSGHETQQFAAKIAQLVHDPDTNFTVVVGTISWSDLTGDVDLQYRLPQSGTVIAYLGLGAGVHVRHGSGQAIQGTLVQDALSDVTAALNGTVGAEFAVDRNFRFTLDGRLVLTSNLSTVSLRGGFMYRFPGRR